MQDTKKHTRVTKIPVPIKFPTLYDRKGHPYQSGLGNTGGLVHAFNEYADYCEDGLGDVYTCTIQKYLDDYSETICEDLLMENEEKFFLWVVEQNAHYMERKAENWPMEED